MSARFPFYLLADSAFRPLVGSILTFDDAGGVTVQGTAPVDDPAELAAACNG
jgi:hypothetical protein